MLRAVIILRCVRTFAIKGSIGLILLIASGCIFVSTGRCQDDLLNTTRNDDATPLSKALEKVQEGFEYRIRTLGYGAYQDPADSSQNPQNDFLKLPSQQFTFEVRPDFRLVYGHVDLSLKPRATMSRSKIDEGSRRGETDEEDDYYINEWLARIQVHERFLVSYGRENLQWGPGLLCSPSNPFFKENGRLGLKTEVAGSDFARSVWVASEAWSVSLIAHTDNGEQKINGPFKEACALKIDYTGASAYASLIGSARRDDRNRLGAYAGWTVSDALLLHAEAMVQPGSEAYYPTAAANPFGAAMETSKSQDDDLQGMLLVGGSYTMAAGPTFTLEYLHHGPGYDGDEAGRYYALRQEAADAYFQPGFPGGLSQQTLSQTGEPELRYLRQNYFMLQYTHPDIHDVLSLTGRWLCNLDDGSSRLYGSMEYALGDHMQFFASSTYHVGDTETEFGTIFKYQWMLGLEYAF